SNHPEAVWHELGTKHIPPRPFLSTAAMAEEREIHDMVGRFIFGAFDRGGPNYRGLMDAIHALKDMAHQEPPRAFEKRISSYGRTAGACRARGSSGLRYRSGARDWGLAKRKAGTRVDGVTLIHFRYPRSRSQSATILITR